MNLDRIHHDLSAHLSVGEQPPTVLKSSPYGVVIAFRTKSNQRLVARLDPSPAGGAVALEHDVLAYLGTVDYPAPRTVLPTVITLAGHPAVVMTFVGGEAAGIADDVPNDQGKLSAAASALAILHRVGVLYDYAGQARGLFDEAEAALSRRDRVTAEFSDGRALVKELEGSLTVVRPLVTAATPTLLHNDFRPQNVFFTGRELSAVIDFEWAVPRGPALKDLAHAALEWSTPDGAPAIGWRVADRFVRAYEDASRQEVDREALLAWMRFGALADASTYALSILGSGRGRLGSHMQRKAQQIEHEVPPGWGSG